MQSRKKKKGNSQIELPERKQEYKSFLPQFCLSRSSCSFRAYLRSPLFLLPLMKLITANTLTEIVMFRHRLFILGRKEEEATG
mmetsp:Transcript_17930/g.21993  ORF Transcript_17930/g.21993 Transcript_17930/m.21993 type:complete len:83 (+) Transcript_17930:304-552(+)